MTSEWLLRQFDLQARVPRTFAGDMGTLAEQRGDHNLNPDMVKEISARGPLTPAAVLVPIVQRQSGLTMLLTQRTQHLSNHPGQISFPGGRCEEEDATVEHTALRETFEEVGLDAVHIQLLGRLDDYITRTGFVVTPVVGLIKPPFTLRLDPNEVAEAFEVPLSFLVDRQSRQRCSRMLHGHTRHFYAMPYGNYFIWGATAGMLVNLADVLGSAE